MISTIKPIGTGGFASVLLGEYKDKPYAVKEIDLQDKEDWDQLKNEILIMKRFNNDNFVQMRAISYKFEPQQPLKIRLILELLDYDL